MKAGDSFKWLGGLAVPHQYVVLTDVDPDTGQVVVVNVTTQKLYKPDWSCVLKRGDHAEIKHPSIIVYAKAQLVDAAGLEADAQSGDIMPLASFDDNVLERIRVGLLKSKQTPDEVYEYCLDNFPIVKSSSQ